MDLAPDFVEAAHAAGTTPEQTATEKKMSKNNAEKSKNQQRASTGTSVTQCMYLGPDRPFGLPLMGNAILCGPPQVVLPPLEAAFKNYPEFDQLFVPVAGLAAARQQIRENGSASHQAYQTIKAASDKLRAQKTGGK